MPASFEWTRWRSLRDPIDPSDLIQPDSPRYESGHLPVGFVLLLWNGHELIGPNRFLTQQEADEYLQKRPNICEYLVLPKPINA